MSAPPSFSPGVVWRRRSARLRDGLSQRMTSGSGTVAAIGIAIGLGATLLGWHLASERETERNSEAFAAVVEDSEDAFRHRMVTYRTALDGAAALFLARDDVTYPEWERYIETLDLDQSLRGLNGIGFVRAVPRAQSAQFFEHARERGAPIDKFHPETYGPELFVIKYLAPLQSNRSAIGLDLSFEDHRNEALTASRKTGKMTITKPITLVQDRQRGTGFLLTRPIYRPGLPIDTQAERLAAFEGWSYAPIKARALLKALTPRQGHMFDMAVYQGDTVAPGQLIYTSASEDTRGHESQFLRSEQIEVAGQVWTIVWRSLPDFERSAQSNEPLLVLLGGTIISLFLGILLITISRREGQVRRKVAEATQELAARDHERSAILEELKAARDQSLAAAKAKSTFLANMSHELRTPMNGVLGFADLLVRADLPPDARRHAELIAESGRVMGRLLDDILDLSRIEAGKMVIAEETLDPAQTCRHVLQLVEPAAQKKNLKLELKVSEDVPDLVLGDKLRIQQVLINLVGNAVKFTDRGYVCIDLRLRDGNLRFEVRDSGIGIDAAKLDVIFGDFVQADDGAARLRGGSGLGLAISRKLAVAMGGDLAVSSQKGIGSTFAFVIPLKATQVVAASREIRLADTRQDSLPPFDQARILLAEDHDINRMLIEAMAQELGLELDTANDGKEAVAMIEHAAMNDHAYQLVLMDVQMPEMDGMEATRVLRTKGYDGRQLPIIALTANAFAEDVADCLAAGMQEHCSKPLTIGRLQQVLERWLPRPGGGTRKAA